MKNRILLLSILLTVSLTSFAEQHRIVGYYTSWATYVRDYQVADIPPDMVTHINYAFANINNSTNSIILGDYYADVDKYFPGDSWESDSLRGNFHQLLILKANHPHIKTLISVGGWTWSTYFSNIALTPQTRNTFARSCMQFITEYGFDGVDLDWEYPVEGGLAGTIHRPEDLQNYTFLCAEIRRQLDSLEVANEQQYYLTIAAPANPENIENIEVSNIIQYLDWINIMTYDFHGPWGGTLDPVTNFNSPLYMVQEDPMPEPYHSQFNLSAAVENYLDLTVSPSKINPGIAFYGRGFGNVANTNNGLFATYSNPCWQGTWEAGVFDYYDLVQHYINMAGYTSYWNTQAKVPWLFNPSAGVMISYDNEQSIADKGEYILDETLSGAMFWEFSGDRDSTLLNTIHNVLADTLDVVVRCNNPLTYPWYIAVPQQGSTLQYTLTFSNNTNIPHPLQVWVMAKLPNESMYGPLLGPVAVNLPPHSNITRVRTQTIPASAPAGTYEYIVNIGTYPNIIIDSHSFLFGKSGAQDNLDGSWNNYGEDFTESDVSAGVPASPLLLSVYPNPFNSSAVITFNLNSSEKAHLKIFDCLGRETASFHSGQLTAGQNSIIWNAEGLPSGTYFVELFDGEQSKTILVQLTK